MVSPKFIEIDGKEDRRPVSERTVAGRYREPRLFNGILVDVQNTEASHQHCLTGSRSARTPGAMDRWASMDGM
jgi:hypothetical protein